MEYSRGRGGRFVVVESPARLATEEAGVDVLPQQRTRAVLWVVEVAEQYFE
jgi:hypothetical protein